MKIDPEIFKAYDIRGVYPGQFNEEIAYLTARAFAQVMKPKLTVLGRDMRTSSPSIELAVCRGLNDQGSDVVRIGLTSTPMYYYAVNAYNGDIGITVTASHNPPQYNGLKLTGPKAIPNIDFVSNDELYRIASEGKFEEPEQKGRIRETVCPIEDYVRAVKKTSGLTDFGGLTLAVDAGNGMDGIILPSIFRDENVKDRKSVV
jgi:phosphomannomutase